MADYGLTRQGFKRKPYTQLIIDKIERARDLFGEDIEVSDRSPLGLYIQSEAWEESKLWDEMENVYFSAFIDDAEGKQLDGLVKYIGLFRRPALHAIGYVKITGRAGRVVEQGTRVRTESSIVFRVTGSVSVSAEGLIMLTEGDVVLDHNGFGLAGIQAAERGRTGNVTGGRIDRLFHPAQGIHTITNPERTSGGLEIETDEELRDRYYRSLSRKGKATRAAIEAAILELPTVKDALVLENITMEVDEYGIPPKSVAPFVFDGNPQQIAEAVLATKSAGIQSYGSILISINDSRGYPHKIGYTRASDVKAYVDVTLVRNAMFRPGYENVIRTAVIRYIGGLDTDGTEFRGLGLGQSIVHSRLVALTYDQGITDAVVKVSIDGENWVESNIDLPIMQIAVTDYTRVVVK
ncbi:MAG: baseplate J/gp47 family protein [Defluviitaleaceae bacterium]|nr:baseplate J/gp47 family protein [Defluviitaleaceae bacterium]